MEIFLSSWHLAKTHYPHLEIEIEVESMEDLEGRSSSQSRLDSIR